MKFRYYFFKEGTREFDETDLYSYFSSNPYITVIKDNATRTRFHYNNIVLNFEADFILARKSSVPNIELLNPRYYDVNLYLEFNALIPDYSVNILIDICQDIVKMFNFYVYCQVFEDVSPFKKNLLLTSYQLFKQAYKKAHPESFYRYHRLEPEMLNLTYEYQEQRSILDTLFIGGNVLIPSICYYGVEGKRKAYTCIEVSKKEPFVFPTFIDMIHFIDDDIFISAKEFFEEIKKYLNVIESMTIRNLYYISSKNIKKISKIVKKGNFSPLVLELKKINGDILDI